MATKTAPSTDAELNRSAEASLVLPYQLVIRRAHERAGQKR